MWFTEDPWPPLMILIVLGVVCGIAWSATQQGKYLLATLGVAALGLVLLVVEEAIVTPAEEVENQVYALADAVIGGNKDKILSFFAKDAEALKSAISSQMDDVDVQEDLRITDLNADVEPNGNRAKSHFRANGNVAWKKSLTRTFATRWNLTWTKEAGTWKIIQVERLDPVRNEVIGTWSGL